jgi:deoxyribodipyrimidine photo-lyase
MVESLVDLQQQLQRHGKQLYLFKGHSEDVVGKLIASLKIDAVVVNRDYTPYSVQRDSKLAAVCHSSQVAFHSADDALLQAPELAVKSDGTPYQVFTPFYHRAVKSIPPKPVANSYKNYFSQPIDWAMAADPWAAVAAEPQQQAPGGRSEAFKLLKLLPHCHGYGQRRNFPIEEATSHLSPHLKFNTCSVREVYWALADALPQAEAEELQRSLYWRDFFSHVAFFFPHVFGGAFNRQFDQLAWSADTELFAHWCAGTTGFPLVDAGMRQLKETGNMHNRVRMVVASFLVKDLHIDWRWGERYFAQQLIDYDPALNNGNWQWCASSGCDAQPYFRIFNPWMQQRKFDLDCSYIRLWVPELRLLTCEAIHHWHMANHYNSFVGYPKPIVDHAVESKISLQNYQRALNQPAT